MSSSYGTLDERSSLIVDAESAPEKSPESNMPIVVKGANDKTRNIISAIVTSLVVLMCGTGLVIFANSKQGAPILATTRQVNSRMSSTATSEPLLLSTITGDYGFWNSSMMLAYPFLEKSYLVEPYRATTITLTGTSSSCSYDWSVTKKFDSVASGSGSSSDGSLTVTLNTVGEYSLDVTENCGDDADSGRELIASLWVKYVRRELSSLHDEDREDFLDAFHTLWTTSTTEGQALYGDRYKSINYFATLHNDGGSNDACDEFHGGVGFLNNHMYLSAYLEQSLQLVNPKVALHYIEYSKYFESSAYQTHLSNQLDGGSWTDILTSKYFGSSDPTTGQIIDGRWANASIPYMTKEFFEVEGIDNTKTFFDEENTEWMSKTAPHLTSPYGLLRSPWNYNPSPYLTRYGSVYGIEDATVIPETYLVFAFHRGVNCTDYDHFFDYVKGKPMETCLHSMEDDTHGKFHFTFGGVGGPQAMKNTGILMDKYNFTLTNIAALTISIQHFFKKSLAASRDFPVNCTSNPWQNNALVSTAEPGKVDGPSCDFADAYYESEDTVNALIDYFFNYDPDSLDLVVSHVSDMALDDKKAVMKLIGNMFPYDGDLAGSGAALDPLFWVAHGSVERVFQMSALANIFTDLAYTHVAHCSGHNALSVKSWLEGLYFTDETVVAEELTNAELTAILVPSSAKYRDLINFVYDTNSFAWCPKADSWLI